MYENVQLTNCNSQLSLSIKQGGLQNVITIERSAIEN